MKQLCTAMAAAFPEIEGATKDKQNPHFKSKYADLGSVVDAIKPALVKHGLYFAQMTHEQPGGVCVETVVCHSSGEQMSFGKLFVPAGKQDAQGYGSALTYARRYSLMTAFGVPAEDDDGNAASRPSKADPANDATPEKVAGISKIKTNLRALKTAGEAMDSLDNFNELISANKDDLTTIKNGNHSWWTGDGADFEGFRDWIVRRREELSADHGQFQMLVASMKECQTIKSLTNWMATNEAMVGELDGADSRKFEMAFQLHESSILEMDRVAS